MKTLVITGIGGFIGLRMAERALAAGWQVRGIDISEAAAQRAQTVGAHVIVADINDAKAIKTLCQGADVVFHTAAIVAEDGLRADYERVNIEGTRSVCGAAQQAGVKRLVHLSSVMVYGFDFPPEVDEGGPVNGQGNVYNDTKLASEQVALSFNTADALEVVVIRPGDVYGIGSQPWIERPLALLKAHQFALPDGGRGVINHVHVDNLIDAVFLAFDNPVAGHTFNVTDGVATPCHQFFDYHAQWANRSLLKLPAALLMGMVKAGQLGAKLIGKPAPASPAGIRFLQRKHRYSITKANQLLGYQPKINLSTGMAALATHYNKKG
jgi:nucleoside-diphosphate-sugar epimerase